jgi:hypothetical protein
MKESLNIRSIREFRELTRINNRHNESGKVRPS